MENLARIAADMPLDRTLRDGTAVAPGHLRRIAFLISKVRMCGAACAILHGNRETRTIVGCGVGIGPGKLGRFGRDCLPGWRRHSWDRPIFKREAQDDMLGDPGLPASPLQEQPSPPGSWPFPADLRDLGHPWTRPGCRQATSRLASGALLDPGDPRCLQQQQKGPAARGNGLSRAAALVLIARISVQNAGLLR